MGLSDTYLLPARYNEAYHLMGDAVVVPVIAWIERHILRELVRGQNTKADKASQEWAPVNYRLRTSRIDQAVH